MSSTTVTYSTRTLYNHTTSSTKAPELEPLDPGEPKTYGTGPFKMKIAGPTWSSIEKTKSIYEISAEREHKGMWQQIQSSNKHVYNRNNFDLDDLRKAIGDIFASRNKTP